MISKNMKLGIIITAISSMLVEFFAAGVRISSPGSGLYDFSRGMLIGLSGVAAVVWLMFVISNFSGRNKGKSYIFGSNKNMLLSILMLILLIGTIFAVSLSESLLLLAGGSIITGAAFVLNITYLRKFKDNIC